MSTERSMNRRRSLFGSIALSLLVGVMGVLAWGGNSAQAATVDSTLSIPVSGSTMAADGTKITFSGNVIVTSSAVMDVVGIPPFTMLKFDCSNVVATSGAGANKVTYDTRGYQVTKIRELVATDVITMTAPIDQTGASPLLAKTWEVTATLNFNTTTGQLTSGTLTATSNTATTAAQ